jgi:hypothetical protein
VELTDGGDGFRASLGLAVGLNNAHIEVSLVLSMR